MRRSIAELINLRFSCRSYRSEPMDPQVLKELADFLGALPAAPFGSQARLSVVASAPGDSEALRGLGTYGFIKGATGFLVGAVGRAPRDLEDYGYLVEHAILCATDLGLGTCWLGGTFTRSSFAKRLGGLADEETMPAVVALGYPAGDGAKRISERTEGKGRLPSSALFFEESWEVPVALPAGSSFAQVLEGVRMAPSASNKQPVRIVHRGGDWHFYIERTRRYGKGSPLFAALRIADLQRVDAGIATCHFALLAEELGLNGGWVSDRPDLGELPSSVEYVATWRARG